jgi:N-acylneuraminate cytidylyltransferase
MKTLAIIPARGGSKRFLRKNIYTVEGKPLLAWAIEAAHASRSVEACYVSTEDSEIAAVARSYGGIVIDRPAHLAEDDVWTQEVLRHAVSELAEQNIVPEVIVRLYSHPRLAAADIDRAVELLRRRQLWEVFSIDREGVENGAIHVYRRDTIFQNALSVYEGVVSTDYADFHTEEELKALLKLSRQ